VSAVAPDTRTVEDLRASHKQLMMLGLSREDSFLQTVIIDISDGKILVGKHRKYAISDWTEKKIDTKNDPLLKELVILHGNIQRIVSEEETKMRLLRVAKILEERGVLHELPPPNCHNCGKPLETKSEAKSQNGGASHCALCDAELNEEEQKFLEQGHFEWRKIKREDICSEMAKIVPYSDRRIQQLLPKEYKKASMMRTTENCRNVSPNPPEMSELSEVEGVLTVEGIAGKNEENLETAARIAKAFSVNAEDEQKQYPFAECLCRGCPKESICPKVVV